MCRLFNDDSYWCEVVLVPICLSLIIRVIEHSFMRFLGICMSSLEKCLLSSDHFLTGLSVWFFFFFFFFNDLHELSCLYILAINPLLVISFANIFSLSVGCLFVFLVVSLAVIKIFFLSLMRAHLFPSILSFFTLGGGAEKILQ